MKARVYIGVGIQNGVTCLRRAYFTPPFKVVNIREDRKDPLLHLMLMCSSPGILDGDDHFIRVDLEEHSRLQLHTQSYQRLFRMKKGAFQTMEIHMKQGSTCRYLPFPTVPHAHSLFTGKNRIFLTTGCRLIWGEVLTCGRKLNGEVFLFSTYHSLTEVFLDGELILRENIFLKPALTNMRHIGQFEGFTHQASLLLIGESGQDDAVRKAIRGQLDEEDDILYGFSAGPVNSLVIRILGNKAEQLHGCLKTIAGSL